MMRTVVHGCALMPLHAQREKDDAKGVDHFRGVLKHYARVGVARGAVR